MQNGYNNHRARHRGKTSTSDILGFPHKNGHVPAKWAEHHKALRELRDRFSGNRTDRTETAKITLSSAGEHLADAATDSYDRDWALAMVSSDQNVLYEIDQALKRIMDGAYGICEVTGKPIESARLKAIPWTRFCAETQAELEGKGISSRTHLGPVGTWFSAGDNDSSEEEDREDIVPLKEAA